MKTFLAGVVADAATSALRTMSVTPASMVLSTAMTSPRSAGPIGAPACKVTLIKIELNFHPR